MRRRIVSLANSSIVGPLSLFLYFFRSCFLHATRGQTNSSVDRARDSAVVATSDPQRPRVLAYNHSPLRGKRGFFQAGLGVRTVLVARTHARTHAHELRPCEPSKQPTNSTTSILVRRPPKSWRLLKGTEQSPSLRTRERPAAQARASRRFPSHIPRTKEGLFQCIHACTCVFMYVYFCVSMYL